MENRIISAWVDENDESTYSFEATQDADVFLWVRESFDTTVLPFGPSDIPHIRAALDKIEEIQSPASTPARQQVDERLLSLWDSVEKMLQAETQQTHEPANPRQGLRPVDVEMGMYLGESGFYHGKYQEQVRDIPRAMVETQEGRFIFPIADCIRFTDIPATQEEAPEPEAKPDIVPGMRVRVREDAERVDSEGNTLNLTGTKHPNAGKVGTVQAHQCGDTSVVLGVTVDDVFGYFTRLSDLTPVEAPAFKFGDRVTVLGERALIQLGPDSDGEYLVVYEGERSDYFEPSEITPGWPETEGEGV